jgi:hypothetical protein
MSEIETFQARLKDYTVRCSIKLDYIVFPIDTYELFEAFKQSGYKLVTPPLPPKSPQGTINVSFSGPFAVKNGTTIDGNTDRMFFGVTNKTFESSFESLNEFMRIIKEKLNIDLSEGISFYEYISNFTCSSDKNPITTIGHIFNDCQILPEINSILRKDVSLYNLKIVPRDSVPNQKEWFEITISPNRIKPTNTFNVEVVFRSSDLSKFEADGENMINYLQQIIELIES